MRVSRESNTTNPVGSIRITRDTPQKDYGREDFSRDLKKAAKKQDRLSEHDTEKR